MCFLVLCLLMRAYYTVPQGQERRTNMKNIKVFSDAPSQRPVRWFSPVYWLLTDQFTSLPIAAASCHS